MSLFRRPRLRDDRSSIIIVDGDDYDDDDDDDDDDGVFDVTPCMFIVCPRSRSLLIT